MTSHPPLDIPIQNVNLRLLQTFMVVAETLSFRVAAEQSRRSTSAISVQIKQLEAQLGMTLLFRTTRAVRLTTAGAELYAGTQRAMHEVRLGLRRLQEAADVKRGSVSVACSPTVASNQMPRILAAFEKDYPGVKVHVRELHALQLFDSVRQGDVDFGVGPKVPMTTEDDLQFEVVLDDPFVAVLRRELAPRRTTRITLKELSGMPLLLQSSAAATRRLFEDVERKTKIKLVSKYECLQVQTLLAMANEGLGVAIVPSSVTSALPLPLTKVLPISDPGMTRQLAIVSIRGRPFTPAAHRLSQLVRERIGDRIV